MMTQTLLIFSLTTIILALIICEKRDGAAIVFSLIVSIIINEILTGE